MIGLKEALIGRKNAKKASIDRYGVKDFLYIVWPYVIDDVDLFRSKGYLEINNEFDDSVFIMTERQVKEDDDICRGRFYVWKSKRPIRLSQAKEELDGFNSENFFSAHGFERIYL